MAPVYNVIPNSQPVESTESSEGSTMTDSEISMLSDYDDESIEILDSVPSTATESDFGTPATESVCEDEEEPTMERFDEDGARCSDGTASVHDEVDSGVSGNNDTSELTEAVVQDKPSGDSNDRSLVDSMDNLVLTVHSVIEDNQSEEASHLDQKSMADTPEQEKSSVGDVSSEVTGDESRGVNPAIVLPEVIVTEEEVEVVQEATQISNVSDAKESSKGSGDVDPKSDGEPTNVELPTQNKGDKSASGTNSFSSEERSPTSNENVPAHDVDSIPDSGPVLPEQSCLDQPPSYKDTISSDIRHFESADGREFVTLKYPLPLKVDQLNCSARLFHVNLEIHLHNEGCLMVVDNSFIARTRILDVTPLQRAKSFEQAKTLLFWQLRIVQVLVDDLISKRDHERNGMLYIIDSMLQDPAQHNALQMLGMLHNLCKTRDVGYQDFCHMVMANPNITESLRTKATLLLTLEDNVTRRNRFLARFGKEFPDGSKPLLDKLRQLRKAIIDDRCKILTEKAPTWLQKLLKDIPTEKLIAISESDIKLFADMSSTLNRDIFEKPLEDLGKRWMNILKSLKVHDTTSLTSPIYFFLCRSLEDLITEITSRTEIQPSELLVSNKSGWHPLKTIKWKTESSFTKSLQHEYYFIMKLIKHFEPATPGARKPFCYQSRFHGSSVPNKKESILHNFIRQTKQFFKSEQPSGNPLGIADEFYVWFCLLDDVLANVLPSTSTELNVFEHIIQNFVKFVREATIDQMETIRVITHNTVRFMVQTLPQHGEIDVDDKKALQMQLNVINSAVLASQGSDSTNIFRDLIDVFNCYWKNRSEVIENIPTKSILDQIQQVKSNLLKIVLIVLEKDQAAENMVQLFRYFNDFLTDLNDVPFDWFIKSIPLFKMNTLVDLKLIEPVENKWSGTENQTFRVVKAKKFRDVIQVLMEEGETIKHYTIDATNKLLSMIQDQLNRTHWKGDQTLSTADQLVSAGVLIAAIRDSLLYLREQAEYVSFELFLDESLKPFVSVMQNSESLSGFCGRISMVRESFWYIRKQNEMSIDAALQSYNELNDHEPNREMVLRAYQRYTEQFEHYMEKSKDENCDERKEFVAKAVRESVETILFKNWDSQFKQEKIPKILAGLGVVWSLMVSEDVASTGKYLKPHCIQILSVLRLLSIDSADSGIAKHLAQVLTGQGKSLILALIASLLALTGHEVQIACYNKYLVERDQNDFEDFYKLFEIDDNITYGTFESLANKIIAPKVNGVPVTLRNLVSNLLFNSENAGKKDISVHSQGNSVLLMDEADVFFTEEYYGTGYFPVTNPEITGVDKIQEQIWSIVSNGNHHLEDVICKIQAFISSSKFAEAKEFNLFYRRPKQYHMLEYVDNMYVKNCHVNKSFFDSHLRMMVCDAIKACKNPDLNNVKLSSDGVVLQKYRERYANFFKVRYSTLFNYFRLKKTNFVPKVNHQVNYGYLNVRCGAISYAMLPKDYSLILGVTGTLTALNMHEKATIKNLYSIRQSSVMPTFFGCSNLLFDPEQDFKHFSSEIEWMGHIFSQAYAAIGSKRSVIVFFEDDSTLDKFRKEYSGQFDRLNVLTENTDENIIEDFISEAGVSRTITLATRGMGRGVDYKTSVAVEQNGGVHVIQSFFSLDVKEETQIKGRTARKDNKGSYELILCRKNLIQQGLARGDDEITYATVDAARQELGLKKNKTLLESIQSEKNSHDATMDYLKSFFK